MSGTFDPEAFLGTNTDAELDTRTIPIPDGEYTAIVDKVQARLAGDKPVLEVIWSIDDADGSVLKATGRDKNTVRQTIWLDVNDNGALATGAGKNVGLGRIRSALNQNTAGQPWNPNMMVGQPAKVQVGQRPDKNDPETIFNDVKRVAAL